MSAPHLTDTDTSQKVLQINLDAARYGTFAEIGAGQEVARWFFRVGGAAGTVAKSMSAYDMTFSDAIYGPCPRYVSRQRLATMLDHEYRLLIERLHDKRGADTCFFVYANTVAARSYRSNNECHGWMGVRFQRAAGTEAGEILIHVRMLDRDNINQQEALGIVGVNLLHAALYTNENPDLLIRSLLDGLNDDRIEVDTILFSGPDFAHLDNRLLNLQLVRNGLTEAVVISPDGQVHQAAEILYRRPILLERGQFRPVTRVNQDMLAAARSQFAVLSGVTEAGQPPVEIMEMTLRNLLRSGDVDPDDFIARVNILGALGKTVMISNYAEFHRLAAYLRRCSKESIGIVLGVALLREIFKEKYYTELEGGILESFGRLFKNDLKLFVFPAIDQDGKTLLRIANLDISPHLRHLLGHLVENEYLIDIQAENPREISFSSREVIRRMEQNDPSWEELVDPRVAEIIKERGYFGLKATRHLVH